MLHAFLKRSEDVLWCLLSWVPVRYLPHQLIWHSPSPLQFACIIAYLYLLHFAGSISIHLRILFLLRLFKALRRSKSKYPCWSFVTLEPLTPPARNTSPIHHPLPSLLQRLRTKSLHTTRPGYFSLSTHIDSFYDPPALKSILWTMTLT